MPNPSLPAIHSVAAFCISYFVVCMCICECQRPPWLLFILRLCIFNCDFFIPLLKFLKRSRKGPKSDKILKVGLDHLLNMEHKGLKMFCFVGWITSPLIYYIFPSISGCFWYNKMVAYKKIRTPRPPSPLI